MHRVTQVGFRDFFLSRQPPSFDPVPLCTRREHPMVEEAISEKIQRSAPINKQTALQMQPGDKFSFIHRLSQARWDDPPRCVPVPTGCQARQFVDYTGTQIGYFRVIGLLDRSRKNANGSLWLVRCACGKYENRRNKALRNPANSDDRCQECRFVAQCRATSRFSRRGRS